MDLVDAWDIYCNQSGYDKTIAVGRSISVDKEKHTLNFEPNTEYPWLHSHYFIYNIQKADGKYLAVTHDYPDQGPNDKGEIFKAFVYKIKLVTEVYKLFHIIKIKSRLI